MITITTNNQYRPILYWHDLNENEQRELKENYNCVCESFFFRYKGQLYDLNDFLTVIGHCTNGQQKNKDLDGWDGYCNETFFSSILVKFSDDKEFVKVGLATS